MNMTTIATVGAASVIAVMGWFLASQATLSARVDVLASQEAATAQSTTDTNTQLAQIETQVSQVQLEMDKLLAAQGLVPGTGGGTK